MSYRIIFSNELSHAFKGEEVKGHKYIERKPAKNGNGYTYVYEQGNDGGKAKGQYVKKTDEKKSYLNEYFNESNLVKNLQNKYSVGNGIESVLVNYSANPVNNTPWGDPFANKSKYVELTVVKGNGTSATYKTTSNGVIGMDYIPKIKSKHSVEDDILSVNPTRGTSTSIEKISSRTMNCGYCSIAFILRRMGYDVIAGGIDGIYTSDWASIFGETSFVNPRRAINTDDDMEVQSLLDAASITGNWEKYAKKVGDVWAKKLMSDPEFTKSNGSETFGFLSIPGHALNYVIENGKPYAVDCQVGVKAPLEEYLAAIVDVNDGYLGWDFSVEYLNLSNKRPSDVKISALSGKETGDTTSYIMVRSEPSEKSNSFVTNQRDSNYRKGRTDYRDR